MFLFNSMFRYASCGYFAPYSMRMQWLLTRKQQSNLLSSCNIVCVSDSILASDNAVAAEKTKVESVELVLPPHANHQVSGLSCTFSLHSVNIPCQLFACDMMYSDLVRSPAAFLSPVVLLQT